MKTASEIAIHRNSECVSGAPSIANSGLERSGLHSFLSRPLLEGLSASVKSQSSGNLFIVSLFFLGGPLAVLRRVARIVVDSLNGMLGGRSRTHIGNKVLKSCPLRANGNSASSIIPVVRVRWVLATLVHGGPSVVFRRMRASSFCIPVHQAALALNFFMETAARYVAPRCEDRETDNLFIATVALTQPISYPVPRKSNLNCREPARTLACNILNRHGYILT